MLKFILYSVITAPVFIFVQYNIGIEHRSVKYLVGFCFFLVSYLLALKLFRKKKWLTFFIITLPVLAIDSTTFINGSDLVPLRSPFGTLFPILGALLGVVLAYGRKIAIIVSTFLLLIFFYLSHTIIVPSILQNMAARISNKVNENAGINILSKVGLLTVDSTEVHLSDTITENCLLLEFYFIPCPPCRAKFPSLVSVANSINSDKFRVVLICNGEATTFRSFLDDSKKDREAGFIYLYDPGGQLHKRLGINSFPYELIVDRGLSVRSQLNGFNLESSSLYEIKTKNSIQNILNEETN